MYIWILLIFGLFYFLLKDRYLIFGKDAPFVPTEANVVERAINIAKVGKDDIFYDLGSGDGRFVIAAAIKGAQAYGIELNRLKFWYSRLWIKILRLEDRAQIIHGDIFKQNYANATVINCYLLQETNDRLENKLSNELKKGTKIVSIAFEFSRFKLEKVDPRGVIYGPIYLYVV